jgi:phosphate transport system protein
MRRFDVEISELKNGLVEMAELVKEMIKIIRNQFINPSQDFFSHLDNFEKEVNISEIVLDNKCLKLIALNQPAGTDLRFITSAMKINTDLERMADETVSIGRKIIIKKSAEGEAVYVAKIEQEQVEKILKMTDIVQEMVEIAIKAFNESDANEARALLEKDSQLGELRKNVSRYMRSELVRTSDEKEAKIYINYIMILRNIQRIGDHATNIGEDVIFIAQGKDIRHRNQWADLE